MIYSVFDQDGWLIIDTTNLLLACDLAENSGGHAYSYESDRYYEQNDQGEWAWRDVSFIVI
jgi:hypothetical protein